MLLLAGLSLAAALGGLLSTHHGDAAASAVAAANEAAARNTRIAFFEARANADPLDFVSLNLLASEYLQRGRETGDVADYNLAEQAATSSLAILPADNLAGLVLLASVRLVQHDYTGAELLAQQAIALKPTDASSMGVLGDAYVGLGQYDAAQEQFETMLQRDASLAALSRLANLAYLLGQNDNAISYWQQAIAQSAGTPLENQAWVHVQLGVTYFQYGDYKRAEAEDKKALKLLPDYVHALAALGQVRAAQGHLDAAIDLYTQAVARLPQPQYVAALGDVYAAAGRQQDAEAQYALVDAIDALFRANGISTDLQISLFYADHDRNLDRALQMAQASYDSAPNVYAADALGWALYKNGQLAQADAMAQQALAVGTPDASFLYHAALIRHALGNDASARDLLQRALRLNPSFSPLHSGDAKTLLTRLEASR